MAINRGALKMTTKLKNGKKRKMYKDGKLVGGQVKLDKNKNNKIDAGDFQMLRGGKKKGGTVKKMKRGGKVKK
jgi:hypothetical protein|tara:strand:+ start:1313 stop:1531 length:219 start_codon:yes stop_codon:yes gene_type:complete